MIEALFYWSMWLLIISVYFFDNEIKRRERLTIIGLIIVITSLYSVTFYHFHVNLSFVFLSALVFWYCARQCKLRQFVLMLISFFLAGFYVWIQYLLYIEPVWMYFPPFWMSVAVNSFITIVLLRKILYRCIVVSAAVIGGEIMTSVMLYYFNHVYMFDYVIGQVQSLAIISMAIVIISIWSLFEMVTLELKRRVLLSVPGRSTVSQRKMNA
ncbi:hypothetical protein LGQ02_08440 [Bacillus shivajii]|uniref:YphA family membrane protein n=1 Tax=Bacillus shivajii TaxID=1983719 RepID=UPI001CF9EB8F|nr:hypothetical protein [Bacillus shivajii]UCZ54757.1 hypothetical protein LGQ02_08440 [Bacillus shivajii]